MLTFFLGKMRILYSFANFSQKWLFWNKSNKFGQKDSFIILYSPNNKPISTFVELSGQPRIFLRSMRPIIFFFLRIEYTVSILMPRMFAPLCDFSLSSTSLVIPVFSIATLALSRDRFECVRGLKQVFRYHHRKYKSLLFFFGRPVYIILFHFVNE